jgi:tetratricopeptide (TPR) repeat protein
MKKALIFIGMVLAIIPGCKDRGQDTKESSNQWYDSVLFDAQESLKQIETISEQLLTDSLNPDLYSQRAELLISIGQIENAIDDYLFLLSINQGDAIVYNNLGHSYYLLQNYNQALKYLNISASLDTTFSTVFHNLGLTYLSLNEYETAEDYFFRALKFDNEFAPAYYGLSQVYYSMIDSIKTFKYLDLAIDIAPDVSEFHLFKGVILAEIEEYNKALTELKIAQALDQLNGEIFYYLAIVMDNISSRAEALKYLSRSKELGYLPASELFDELNRE